MVLLAGEQCWGEHDVSLRRGSRVTDERDGRLVLCLWPDCVQLWAPLWTCSFAYVWQERPGGGTGQEERPLFKMEAKGRANKHTVYADTYPCIICTTAHTTSGAKREKKAFYSSVNM